MFSWLTPKRTPLIVAHRGSSAVAPENTIAAFRQAIDDGADAIELDVHLSKDDKVVVIHDSRLERTTSGRGLVRHHTLDQLKQLDAGYWFHYKFKGEKLPTLAEVFELFRGKIGINIEIKSEHPRRQQLEVVSMCCQLIEKFKVEDSVLISSFRPDFIKTVKLFKPHLAVGLLYDPVLHRIKRRVVLAKSLGARYLILNTRNLRKKIVQEAHLEDIFVGEYTVDTKHRLQRSLRYGVNAVFTNNPYHLKNIYCTIK